ncbi:2-hydroxyacyl-CoA lyase [Aspergillus sclerotialis]|uniref:2-hydroxyacyl-CoA lyase n=1 Tax=Aspergillus sclerotialis TaxID=2070753 RepID=A0A3A2ZN81_9EURO|nr:2-hydroxyacyl-CoA lyase [Aspergillus sclerotialis]
MTVTKPDPTVTVTFAQETVRILETFDCAKAFGVSGGYIFPLWHFLDSSRSVDVHHCRSEAGATFAALEYSLHKDALGIAFATTGPASLNAYAALRSARSDGGKIVFLSAITSEDENGPKKAQDTTSHAVYDVAGESLRHPFSECLIIRQRSDLLRFCRSLRDLRAGHGGCLGVFIKPDVQMAQVEPLLDHELEENMATSTVVASPKWIDLIRGRLTEGKAVIWAGYGAKESAGALLKLVEHYRVPVMSTPRAKGVFPETHPLFWGCSGIGGHIDADELTRRNPEELSLLVLGSRLEETSSLFMQLKVPVRELIVVNSPSRQVERNLPSHALIIDEDITNLLGELAQGVPRESLEYCSKPHIIPEEQPIDDKVHPVNVVSAVQHLAINTANYMVIGDIGNTLSWTTHYLRFDEPGRFRLGTHDAAMSSATCGAVGVGACGTPTVVITGDGAMLLQNEVSTAVRYQMPIIWVVMNDQAYNMCGQVWSVPNTMPPDLSIPETDFAMLGSALGALGFAVTSSKDFRDALQQAIRLKAPAVIDVKIDGSARAPVGARAKSLRG